MADVFEPRKVVTGPAQFGRFRDGLQPAPGYRESSDEFRAAELQHIVAYEFRRWLGEQGSNVGKFADRSKDRVIQADRLRRVLRGETMMQFTDLMLMTRTSKYALTALLDYFGTGDTEDQRQIKNLTHRVQQLKFLLKLNKVEVPEGFIDEESS